MRSRWPVLVTQLWLVAWLAGSTSVCAAAPDPGQHWAFQPVRPVEPPSVRAKAWVKNPVDRFILAGLEAKNLKPAPPAAREQFIRRVTFDLAGLPPTPEEIDAFVKDRSPDASERLIDRLLASPRYGERWARHWLDLARYAESDGFEHDAIRAHSWRYRDYVIQSFNADKSYDRFVQEQIAGDELWPEDPVAIAATAFNLLGPDMVDSADQVQRRLLTLSDMTDTTAFAFLGLTLGCARCHNHKSEPFTQRDYYSLQAFFAPAVFERELAVPSEAERRAHEIEMAKYRAASAVAQGQLDQVEQPYREKLYAEKLSALSEDAQLAHKTPKEKRTMEQEGTVQETAPMLKITEAELIKAFSTEDKARRKSLQDELRKIPKPAPLPQTMALKNTNGAAPKTFVLARGDYNNPAEEVEPAFPVVLRGSQKSPSAVEPSRRTALARWLSSPENPLTARVMVNRIWQHHFGRGLVASTSNFGTQGARPTHPELLDWLANEFVASGWSIKVMHRLILRSAAYEQSSAASPDALARDPENKLFSRQNKVRLEGEVIRDSLLAISGRLNPKMGGPGVFPPIPADITRTSKNWTASADPDEHRRRSIYVFARRNLRFPFLEVFDAPDSNLSCPERGQSTTAPQSLTLLNSDEVMDAAEATAGRLVKEATTDTERIGRAYRLVLGRAATARELKMSRDFLQSCSSRREEAHSEVQGPQSEAQRSDSGLRSRDFGPNQSLPTSAATKESWTELCRALFNLNAFVYVD